MKNKISPIYLFGTGAFLAYVSLMVNQQFPVMVSFASILSPTGAQVTVSGLRIKHWVVGAVLLIVGAMVVSSKNKLINNVSFVVMGIGTTLILDEYIAVEQFILTGQYP